MRKKCRCKHVCARLHMMICNVLVEINLKHPALFLVWDVLCVIVLLHTFCCKIGRNCYFIEFFTTFKAGFCGCLAKKILVCCELVKIIKKLKKVKKKNSNFLNKNSRYAWISAKCTRAWDVHATQNWHVLVCMHAAKKFVATHSLITVCQ